MTVEMITDVMITDVMTLTEDQAADIRKKG